MAISAGSFSACALMSGGTVKCWGANNDGQVDDTTKTGPETCGSMPCATAPITVQDVTGATAVSVNDSSGCAIVSGGTVRCWGGTASSPTTIERLAGATAISVGQAGLQCALLAGAVQCWEMNSAGRDGTLFTISNTPFPIEGLDSPTVISVGEASACAVVSGGAVACWRDAQAFDAGAEPCRQGAPCSLTALAVPGLTGAIAVAAGDDFACALLSGGTIQCWGNSSLGELGNATAKNNCEHPTCTSPPVTVTGITDATAIAAGDSSACALLPGGAVWCWGRNESGQLGDGTTTDSPVPVEVHGLSGVTAISVGEEFACALLSTGSLTCWGINIYGQLGIGNNSGPDMCSDDGNAFACSKTPVTVE